MARGTSSQPHPATRAIKKTTTVPKDSHHACTPPPARRGQRKKNSLFGLLLVAVVVAGGISVSPRPPRNRLGHGGVHDARHELLQPQGLRHDPGHLGVALRGRGHERRNVGGHVSAGAQEERVQDHFLRARRHAAVERLLDVRLRNLHVCRLFCFVRVV